MDRYRLNFLKNTYIITAISGKNKINHFDLCIQKKLPALKRNYFDFKLESKPTKSKIKLWISNQTKVTF